MLRSKTWAASAVNSMVRCSELSDDELARLLGAALFAIAVREDVEPWVVVATIWEETKAWHAELEENDVSWKEYRAETIRAFDQEMAKRRDGS